MSSRQEEKEHRKQERLEREAAEAAASKRKRLVATVGGVIAAVAAVVVAVLLLTGGGGKDDPDGPAFVDSAPIPAQKIMELPAAAQAAGCAVREFADEGQEHLPDDKGKFDGYKTNPPTSGTHRPTPAQDGVYDPGAEPDPESWVHTLEHGRIILQYKPGTPKMVVGQLQTLFNEPVKGGPDGYHMALLRNNTGMKYEVAAVAWRHYVACNQVNDKTWDALRAFRDQFVDTAPEQVP